MRSRSPMSAPKTKTMQTMMKASMAVSPSACGMLLVILAQFYKWKLPSVSVPKSGKNYPVKIEQSYIVGTKMLMLKTKKIC